MASILDEYAQGAADRLGGRTVCSLTLNDHGSLRQIASNDPRAQACDLIEVRDQDGPCVQAMANLHSVYIRDLASWADWPNWRQVALDSGFRSFVALPGFVSDDITVAANVYSEDLATWTPHEFITIDVYVQELAAAIGRSQA
jgi:GAF domain